MTPAPYFKPYFPLVTCPNASNAVDMATIHWGDPTWDLLYALAHIVPIFKHDILPTSTCWNPTMFQGSNANLSAKVPKPTPANLSGLS